MNAISLSTGNWHLYPGHIFFPLEEKLHLHTTQEKEAFQWYTAI
jgi:hypothetical protein